MSKINYSKLNPAQYEAAMHMNGPLLILAGAGTGKTATLTYRLAHLLENGVDPKNILLLTFTNKAADEMLYRAQKMLGDDFNISELMASTYHSFALKTLKEYGSSIGLSRNFSIADMSASKDMIKLIKEEHKLEEYSSSFFLSILSLAANLDEEISEVLIDKGRKLVEDTWMFEDMQKEYIKYKKDRNILDYDDLLTKLLDLLCTDKVVCKELSERYQYILVDEYQDSNRLQFNILCKLCITHDNLCVVGDDCQSIYSWRGADFRNILRFPKQFPGCKKVILDTNYRSTQEILDLANELVYDMEEKFEKELKAYGKTGNKPILYTVQNKYDENELCLTSIKNKILNGTDLKDICVLGRTSTSLNFLELALKKEGIPYRKFGGLKFLEKAHVRDFICLLKVLVNQEDELSWIRVLSFLPNLGQKTAMKIFTSIQKDGFEGLLDKKYEKKKFGKGLSNLYSLFLKLSTETFEQQIVSIILYLEPFYKDKKEYKDNYKKRLEELALFQDFTGKYKNCEEFLDDIILNGAEEDTSGDKITLSTIHSAKGLEFENVYLLDCTDGVIPTKRKDGYENIEEDKRLLYVAVTRAKSHLYLFHSKQGMNYNPLNLSPLLTPNHVKCKYENKYC